MPKRKQAKSRSDKTGSTGRSVWPVFLAAHKALVARVEERLRAAGLPELSWYDVLWALERAPQSRLRMYELAAETVIARSNITRLVDRLEAAGLVGRNRDCTDRRGSHAVLTEAGREMRQRMWSVYGPAIEDLFSSRMRASEAATVRAVLMRLVQSARDRGDARA
jgi:DNA-binding MarR family transcriptional regulator